MKNKINSEIGEGAIPDKNFRGKVAEEWMEELWNRLLNKLLLAKSKKHLQGLLEKLISEEEKKTILRRIAVMTLVRAGKSYREIGEILWIAHPTISTIKKNFFSNHKNYKSYLAFYGGPRKYSSWNIKIKKSLWEELFGDVDLWELLKNPPRPPGIGLRQ